MIDRGCGPPPEVRLALQPEQPEGRVAAQHHLDEAAHELHVPRPAPRQRG